VLEKGTRETLKGHEWKSYGGPRIKELEKELAESEANLAEVPGLREKYIKQFRFLARRLTGYMQH